MSRHETTERFREFARRSRDVVLLAAITGALTGLGVALFERAVVEGLFDRLIGLSPWVLAFMPMCGLLLAWLSLRFVARSENPGTADAYLHAFHDPTHPLRIVELPGRMLAAIATLGFGGAMGLEGPSLYLGASIGSFIQRRFRSIMGGSPTRLLLVAGAAAGVAAIFKAPATGAVFALEVPYQDDLARRMLLPALVASASGYLAFVAINGTAPLFAVRGNAPFTFADLAGAAALGVAAGVGRTRLRLVGAPRQGDLGHRHPMDADPRRGAHAGGTVRGRTRAHGRADRHRCRLRNHRVGHPRQPTRYGCSS